MTVATEATAVETVVLATTALRELNERLHGAPPHSRWRVLNPNGAPAVAAGLDAEIEVEIDGHVGYYCAGMNKLATVRVHGNAGTGLAENMMSGLVVVDGNASQSAGATGRGGVLVVHGSVGHMSAFMAQRGCLVVCGDAGEALGDSIYEAHLYVRGEVASLGADCVEKELRDEHIAELQALLDPIACKPAVLAETDEWVAMASEYRAIAVLPGAADARIWEPEPRVVYAWEKEKALA